MRQTFSLGRISGIRIGVNWSVLVIVALLAYGLAAGQFSRCRPAAPGRGVPCGRRGDGGGLHGIAAGTRAGTFAGGAA